MDLAASALTTRGAIRWASCKIFHSGSLTLLATCRTKKNLIC